MTLTGSFQELAGKLECLRMTFEEFLQWAVTEGKPVDDDHVLVSRYDDLTSDLIGLVEEAKAEAWVQANLDRAHEGDARRALIACHERVNQASHRFFSELISFDALNALDRLARERGKQWPSWVSGVKDALERCRQPLFEVDRTLLQCWQEWSDRAGPLTDSIGSGGHPISRAGKNAVRREIDP